MEVVGRVSEGDVQNFEFLFPRNYPADIVIVGEAVHERSDLPNKNSMRDARQYVNHDLYSFS